MDKVSFLSLFVALINHAGHLCSAPPLSSVLRQAKAYTWQESVQPIIDQWHTQWCYAMITPRVGMGYIINKLKDTKSALEELPYPDCVARVRMLLLTGMTYAIMGLTIYLNNDNDGIAQSYLDKYIECFNQASDEIKSW